MILNLIEVILILTRIKDNYNQRWCFPNEEKCKIKNEILI